MPADTKKLPAVYRVLSETRNVAADLALVEAIADLDADQRLAVLPILFQRRYEPALVALVSQFDTYDDQLKRQIADRVGDLEGALRLCLDDSETATRLAAIGLIDYAGDVGSAELIARAVGHRCPQTGRRAAVVLLNLVRRFAETAATQASNHTSATPAVDAVRHALHVWPVHFRGEVLLAAAIVCEWFEDEFLERVGDPRSKLRRAFENLLIAARDDLPGRFVYVTLRCADLSSAAVALLDRAADPLVQSVLDASWMVGDPRIARGVARIRSLRGVAGALGGASHAQPRPQGESGATLRGVVRLVRHSGVTVDQKAAVLGQLALGTNVPAAREAFWALCGIGGDASTGVLRSMAGRSDEPLARIAKLEIRRRTTHRGMSGSRRLLPPGESRAASSFDAFQDYWSQFEHLDPRERAAIGRSMLGASPEYPHLLRTKLGSGDAGQVLKALWIVGACTNVTGFRETLYGHARHADPGVRAKSVELLGRISTPTSYRVLYHALEDGDERVQANAVAAIDRLRIPDRGRRLMSKLTANHRRVRAGAIKALLPLRVRKAAIALINLLHSAESADRLAGIWVVNELGLGSVAGTLKQMAGNDPDPTVRRRARAALSEARGPVSAGSMTPEAAT